jgi:hypothetical protein
MKTLLLNNLLTLPRPISQPDGLGTSVRKFIGRKSIKLHLALTEAVMRNASTKHLTKTQKESRLKNLDLLHTYWTREEFPNNIENPGQRLPYIRDSRGVLCAMGFLLWETGEQDYVDQLTKENNHVYIKDVNNGPLFAWLEANGISKDEAMRIQPTYDWEYGGGTGYTPTPPTLVEQIMSLAPLAAAVIVFIFSAYITWVLIKALNLSGGKRTLAYIYFTVINILLAMLAYSFVGIVTNQY